MSRPEKTGGAVFNRDTGQEVMVKTAPTSVDFSIDLGVHAIDMIVRGLMLIDGAIV